MRNARRVFIILVVITGLVGGAYLIYNWRADASNKKVASECRSSEARVIKNQKYGADERHQIDLYLPNTPDSCQPMPIVLWVHGGGFTSGDKEGVEYKQQLFNKESWAFASINYRLNTLDSPTVHPAQAEDVAAALSWLDENSEKYKLNQDNIMLVGFSAGAYLVSLVSTDDKYLKNQRLNSKQLTCTVALDSGAYDLPTYLGSTDAAVSLYQAILPNPEEWLSASPIHLARKANYLPGFLLITRGEGVRPEVSTNFARALRAKHIEASAVSVNDYDHGQFDTMVGVPGDKFLTPKIMNFLRKCNNY